MMHLLSKRKPLCNQDTQKPHKCCLFVFNSCPGGRRVQCFLYVSPVTLSFSSACPQGTFKSFQGAGLCQQCPLNSRSTIEAATLCSCRNGYYRGDMDKPEDVCTSESVSLSNKRKKQKYCTNLLDLWVQYPSGWLRHVCNSTFLAWNGDRSLKVRYLLIKLKANICFNLLFQP